MSLPYGAMGWPAVCDYGISWPYSFIFETIIIVDDNIIVLHKIELKICSILNKLKIIRLPETKVISFRGLYNLLYFSVRKRPWHVLFLFLYITLIIIYCLLAKFAFYC